jgi:hypothetical protein
MNRQWRLGVLILLAAALWVAMGVATAKADPKPPMPVAEPPVVQPDCVRVYLGRLDRHVYVKVPQGAMLVVELQPNIGYRRPWMLSNYDPEVFTYLGCSRWKSGLLGGQGCERFEFRVAENAIGDHEITFVARRLVRHHMYQTATVCVHVVPVVQPMPMPSG